MSTLLIIDVQRNYHSSEELAPTILKESKKFSNIVYIYDTWDGEAADNYDMWQPMAKAFCEKSFNPKVIEKQYGFFADFQLDDEYPHNLLVQLGKLLIKYNLYDADLISISDNQDLISEYDKLLKKFNIEELTFGEDFNTFLIPKRLYTQLIEVLPNKGITLVGGSIDACLKEIRLLLDIFDIEYTVDSNLIY